MSGVRVPAQLAALLALFIFLYLAALAVVQVFTYPPVTLASRMLSPVHFAAIILLFALGHLIAQILSSSTSHSLPYLKARSHLLILYVLALSLAGSYTLRGALIARQYWNTGIGYTAPSWQNSTVIEAIRHLPPSVPLISNDVTAIMFLVDRPAYPLQEIFSDQPPSSPLASFLSYGQGDDTSQRVFREQGAALVLFNESLRDDFSIYGDRLDERLAALVQGLHLYYHHQDGAIYFYAPPLTPP